MPAQGRELACLRIEQAGRADVYCLTVPDTGNFVLAGGHIVSNCADTGRYACMSRPYIPRAKEDNKPADLIYEVKDGRLVANMSVMDIVQAKMRKKRLEN